MTAEWVFRSTPGHQLVASSAGTIARLQVIYPQPIEMLAKRGVDCRRHVQTKLDAHVVVACQLLVAMGLDHQAYIWRQFGVHAPLFNELAYNLHEPVLDLHEALPQWQREPQAARDYVRGVIAHMVRMASRCLRRTQP
ncbi:MAG: hypothetical protein OEU26_35830 [Candidatus Tectomicrobia bacterium]|nr:hypothetical protein [Candidatus Tectomicrobia bacterium]